MPPRTKTKNSRSIWIWFTNVSCLAQILGVIPSTLLMIEPAFRGQGTCKESFFTTYNTTVGCTLTGVGRIVIFAHFGFDCLFALFIVFLYLLSTFLSNHWSRCCIVLFWWFLIPVFIPITIVAMIAYIIRPQLLYRKGTIATLF